MKFVSKEAQNSNIIATILNSTQQPCYVFVTSFRPRDFVQMASEVSWLFLSHIILSQICSKLRNDSIEDSEVNNRLRKKKDFADLVRDAKSANSGFSFFSFRQFRVRWNDVTWKRPGCQGRLKIAASEVASFERNFFRIACTSEAEASVSGKAECLLAVGEDTKNKLFGVTSLTQNASISSSWE